MNNDNNNIHPETTTLQPVRPSYGFIFQVLSQRLMGVVEELDRLGMIAPAPGDLTQARQATRTITVETIELMAARAVQNDGVIGGVPFDATALREHLAFSAAAGPFVGLMHQVAERIEGQIVVQRAEISGRIKAAQGALAAHDRLGASPGERMLLGELRTVRPRRPKRTRAGQKKEAPKPA